MSLKLLERQQQKKKEDTSFKTSSPYNSKPFYDSYGREIVSPSVPNNSSYRSPATTTTTSSPLYSSSRSTPPPPSSLPPRTTTTSSRFEEKPSPPVHLPKTSSFKPNPPTTTSLKPEESSLSAWSRAALESRVLTLERLLSESTSSSSRNKSSSLAPSDRELSEHLAVTVRKNRELRVELEVCKSSLTNLLKEREDLFAKLNADNALLQELLQEATRAKDSLGKLIQQLSAEKQELRTQLELAQEEIEQLKVNNEGESSRLDISELNSNVEDVAMINEGLRESMRLMQLKASMEQHNRSGLFEDEEML